MEKQKIISVSGLYSGIGKTELCCSILSLLPGMCAVKVTMNDHATELIDDEASIMVPGKDTWRFKTTGAAQVIWVRAQEEHLREVLAEAPWRLTACPLVLIEGNSAVAHVKPDMAFFVCDGRIAFDKPPKPSRAAALAQADIVINNVRGQVDASETDVARTVKQYNQTAPVVSLDIMDRLSSEALLRSLLKDRGFL